MQSSSSKPRTEYRKVQRIKTSDFISIPKRFANKLGITKGSILSIDIENDKLVIAFFDKE